MKTLARSLPALLALLLCSPAAAVVERGLVIEYPLGATEIQISHVQNMAAIYSVLNGLGVAYDTRKATALKTLFIQTGAVTEGFNGTTGSSVTQYTWVVHAGWSRGLMGSTSGMFPDSLTLRAGWPSVPQIFIGKYRTPSNEFTDGATCSTGIKSDNPYSGSTPLAFYQTAAYVPRSTYVWPIHGFTGKIATQSGADAAWYARGTWRPLVGLSTTAASHRHAVPLATASCRDCDSLYSRSNSPDTVIMWARYRSATETAPLIFLDLSGATNEQPNIALFAKAVAMVDSVRGGDVILKTKTTAFVVDAMFQTGTWNLTHTAGIDTAGVGMFCQADSCDSVNVAATMDSLDALQVPITFAVDVDSMGIVGISYQKRLIERVRRRQVAIASYSGAYGGGALGASGNATSARIRDLFGHARARQIFRGTTAASFANDSGFRCTGVSAANGRDSSISCMLASAIVQCETMFPGKLSRVLMPPGGDWTPRHLSKRDHSPLDSLLWLFHRMGFSGVVVQMMSPFGNADRSLADPNGPHGHRGLTQALPVRDILAAGASTKQPIIGKFAVLASRGMDTIHPKDTWFMQSTHLVVEEVMPGLFDPHWYYNSAGNVTFHPQHYIHGAMPVVRVKGQNLGGSGQGTYPTRHAWRILKSVANQIWAINASAGREVIRIGTLDEVAGEVASR